MTSHRIQHRPAEAGVVERDHRKLRRRAAHHPIGQPHVIGADDPQVSAASIVKIEKPDEEEPFIPFAARMGATFLHGAAVTIHKAQGLTLDKVFIDFDRGMFAHGQAYVAFSRARSLEGLEISRALRPRDLVIDRSAFAFGELETIENTDAYLLARFAKGEGVLL